MRRWSGKKYVRRYHKSLNIEKLWKKKVTGEKYVWYSVRALHVTLLVLLYIFIHISANMSRIGLKFSQMILHTSTSKMMNNLPFLLVVLHKPTLWPSTFKNMRKHLWTSPSLYLWCWVTFSKITLNICVSVQHSHFVTKIEVHWWRYSSQSTCFMWKICLIIE